MSKRLHVARSPLTNKIYTGSVSKDGTCWLSDKTDVTNDTICAVIDHIIEFEKRSGKKLELSSDGKPVIRVTIEHL
jgi:uncharacterized protein (DUF2237 family)